MTTTLIPPQAFTNRFTFGEPKLHTDGEVLVVSFGKEGWLYSIEEMGILRKWNPDSGQQLEWHALSDLESLWTFSADGRVLASASDDLTIWDATSGRLLTSIPQPAWVTALAFHSDASFVAVGHDDGAISYWDAPGHHRVFEKGFAYHKKPISALAISPNGQWLAAASEDKTISVWNLATGGYHGCLIGHTDRIPALAWHPSSKFLVSAGWDTTARIWDANTLQPVMILNAHAIQVNALAFSHDGQHLACADSAHVIHLWNFDTKEPTHKLKVPGAEIRTIAFSRDGKYFACNGDRIIHVWNPATGQAYDDLGPHPVAKTTVSIHRDGKSLASNSGGGVAAIWNTISRQLVTRLEADKPVLALAFSPDGKWIAGAVGTQIRLWDASGKFIADWDGPTEDITTLAFSPDSATIATGSAHGVEVWLWRVADGEPSLLIQDALDGCTVESLAFHPDNNTLAVGGVDWMATSGSNGAISLWNLHEKAEFHTFVEGTTALAIHPSGDILASTTLDDSICLWDLQLRQLVQEFIGHDGPVTCLAFSPDGAWLVSGGEDHTLRIWDDKGNERAVLEIESHATALTFSADGEFLYVGHANTTCSQWQLPAPFRGK